LKVLVAPEDPTLDQYVLKPIVERLFADLGKTPRVLVLSHGLGAKWKGVLEVCPELDELKQTLVDWLSRYS
jgi:hypothetical protein